MNVTFVIRLCVLSLEFCHHRSLVHLCHMPFFIEFISTCIETHLSERYFCVCFLKVNQQLLFALCAASPDVSLDLPCNETKK